MAEFNSAAKTTPKATMRTELWYATNEDGVGLKQIFLVQEIPKPDSAPEQITYTSLESAEEFGEPGKKKSNTMEVPVLYTEEQHDELKEISESRRKVWFFIKYPDDTAVVEGKPLTRKFSGTFCITGDAMTDGGMIKDTITIYKNGKTQEIKGLPSVTPVE